MPPRGLHQPAAVRYQEWRDSLSSCSFVLEISPRSQISHLLTPTIEQDRMFEQIKPKPSHFWLGSLSI